MCVADCMIARAGIFCCGMFFFGECRRLPEFDRADLQGF